MTNQDEYYTKPNPFCYGVIRLASKFLCKFVYNVKIERNELRSSSGKRILIANHESFIDFFTAYAAIPKNSHLIVSNSMMRTIPIAKAIAASGVVPKNQFQTGIIDMRRMKAVIDREELLVMYPAGLMTESGASTPIPLATAKVLKWFGADIYVAKVSGSYLTKPKWGKVGRRGKITLDIYKLADSSEFAKLSPEESAALINEHLSFDAYRNNDKNKVYYRHGDNVEGLENVLYKCPKCGEEYKIDVKNKNTLVCASCGYSVKSDNYGILASTDSTPAIYKYPSDWHAFIEKDIYEHLKENPEFSYETEAEIMMIKDKKHRFESVGSGRVEFNNNFFVIDAKVNGEDFKKEMSIAQFPILPFKPGKCFEIQDGEEIYRIVPRDGRIVMKWIMTLKSAFKLRHEA